MGAVLGVELIHVGDVLEVVGVQGAVLQGVVGGHVVVVLHDVQCVPVLGQGVLDLLEDGRVGGGGGADLDGLAPAIARAAAGGQRQDQGKGQHKCNQLLFHHDFLLFLLPLLLIRRSDFTDRAVPMD